MNASAKILALFLVACATSAYLAAAQRGGAGEPPARGRGLEGPKAVAVPESRFAALPDQAGWQELITRDARLTFTERTSFEARAVLESPDSTVERRSIAMMALGAKGTTISRPRLLRVVRDTTDLERQAAILALGEMNAATSSELEEWLQDADPRYAECALLAMLRCDRRAERRRVEEIAADPAQRLAVAAGDLLVFALNPSSSKPTRAAALLLRLRFEAARLHGLVDGENWRLATIRGLAAKPDFARDVVLFATSNLKTPPVRDHVFAMLDSPSGRARLHAAVSAIPAELSEMVENELWRPRDVQDWRDLLDEIDLGRVERLTLPIVRAAFDVPEVRYRAIALASLAGDEDLSPLIGLDPAQLGAEDRIWVALAIGARSDPGWLERFAVIGEDRNPRVRAAFLVARLRQGQRSAYDAVTATLADPDAPGHAVLVEAMCAAVHDPAVAVSLETRFVDAQGEEKTLIAATLCLEGRSVGRTRVRAALAVEPPPEGPLALRLVRALRRDATAEDIGVLRSLFPTVNGDLDLDRELALALLERSEPDMIPIARAALWSSDFDLSVLAAGVVSNAAGMRALINELRTPPVNVTSGDLRRVGFAVGEWGGIETVHFLARELRWATGDPALQGALLGGLVTRTQ